MTFIQRQNAIVAVIQKLYRKQWANPGLRSKAINKLAEFNEKRMKFAGYSAKEAKASFLQCSDIALLNNAYDAQFVPSSSQQSKTKQRKS